MPRRSASEPVLAVTPTRPVTEAVMLLQVHNAPAGATNHTWDLDGTGRYSTNTGRSPSVRTVYRDPGPRVISVRVTDKAGTHEATVNLFIHARIHPVQLRARATSPRRSPGHVTLHAHAAADPAVAIADFAFAPGSTTVHVGDTITWTNNGPSSHTATANDGSFATGVLSKGQSGSHTFTQPGTFAYFCKIHPFMHGTIVVLAATQPATHPSAGPPASSKPPAPASASARTHTTPHAAPGTASAPSLPVTGLDLASVLLVGLVVTGLGAALRRATPEG